MDRPRHIIESGRLGDLPLPLITKIWNVTGSRRARARWNSLRDYFFQGNMLRYWLEQVLHNTRLAASGEYRPGYGAVGYVHRWQPAGQRQAVDPAAFARMWRFSDFREAMWREITGGASDPESRFYVDPDAEDADENWQYSPPSGPPPIITTPWSYQRRTLGGVPLPGRERRDFNQTPGLLNFLTPGLGHPPRYYT